MPSSAEARMGVRVALAGLWAGSGGTVDFQAVGLRLPEEPTAQGPASYCRRKGMGAGGESQACQGVRKGGGQRVVRPPPAWGGGRRKSSCPSPATRSDPGFPYRLCGPDAAPVL